MTFQLYRKASSTTFDAASIFQRSRTQPAVLLMSHGRLTRRLGRRAGARKHQNNKTFSLRTSLASNRAKKRVMERFERVEEFCQRTGFPLPESPEERLVLECFLQAYEHKSTRTLLKIFKYLFIFMAIVLIVPSNIMACIVGYPLIGVLYVLHVIVQLALVMMNEVAKSMKISPTASLGKLSLVT